MSSFAILRRRHMAVFRHAMELPFAPNRVLQAGCCSESLRKAREVRHVEHARVLADKCQSRFYQVFTKLRVLDFDEYKRVVLLDLDMLVRHCADDVFTSLAPRHAEAGRDAKDANEGEFKKQTAVWLGGDQGGAGWVLRVVLGQ